MADRGAGNDVIRLHRVRSGFADYRFEHDGTTYYVIRTTDGTLGSPVIWDVQREGDRKVIAHFTTLRDLRERWGR